MKWILISLLFSVSFLVAQEPVVSKEEIQKRWKRLTSPGKSHEKLKPLLGKWNFTLRLFSRHGEKEYQGTSLKKSILAGRFIEDHIQFEMEGKALAAILTLGYDNHSKQYEYTWLSNSDTRISVGKGSCDSTNKIFTFHSTSLDSIHNITYQVREVIHIIDQDKHRYETYQTGPDGKEIKKEEILFVRIKEKTTTEK